jgi:ribosomal protein S18 acetylase RimI-like enzyme
MARIIVSDIETEIIPVKSISKEIINLYKKAELDDENNIVLPSSESIIMTLLHNKKIIGLLVLTPSESLKRYANYWELGGLLADGYHISSLCGDPLYKGVAKRLIYAIPRTDVKYLYLTVDQDLPYIRKLYEKFGFEIVMDYDNLTVMRLHFS